MRFSFGQAFAAGCVGLLTLCAVEARAETVFDELPGASSPNLLVGPSESRKSQNSRQLSAPPSTSSPADLVGRGREISPAERQEMIQNRSRDEGAQWGNSRDRN